MGQIKGHTGNPFGRKAGTPNKLTKELRSILKNIIENELLTIPKNLESLEPEKRIEIVIKLLPFVLPKVVSIEMDDGEPMDWSLD